MKTITNGRTGFSGGPLAAAVGLALLVSGTASAQVLEEVMVTAQKREQSLQDVGISVTAFTGDQMRALGVEESHEVAGLSPGVHIGGSMGGQNSQFTIRGVTQNDYNDIVEAPNAVYVDEGYIAIAQGQSFAVMDIERVEILKGPQGTLFGRNATGGLIHYITRKPTFETEGYLDVTYGSFDTPANADQTTFEGAFGGPLVADKVAGRVAFRHNKQDGYLKNIYPFAAVGAGTFGASDSNSPGPGAGADLGGDETFSWRSSLLFTPQEDMSFSVSFNASSAEVSTSPYQSKATIGVLDENGELINVIDAGPNETRATIAFDGSDGGSDQGNSGTLGFPFGRPVPGGDFFGYIDPDGEDFTFSGDYAFKDEGEIDTWGVNARFEWNFSDAVTFVAISDFKDYEKKLFLDVDAAPVNQLVNYQGVDATSFTQEFRLIGERDRMRWVAGFYYLNIDNTSNNGLKAPRNSLPVLFAGFPEPGVDIGVIADMETDSYSLFGQLEFDLAEQWTLVAGLRVMQEEKEFEMDQPFFISLGTDQFNNGPFLFSARPAPFIDDTSDTLWAGKLQLDWRPADDLLVYAGINRGIKAGSFNAPIPGGLPFPDSTIPYDEEVLTSLETGFKLTIMDGRGRLNGTVFYYDYSDYQAFLFTGVSGVVVNADAETYGAELELQLSPGEGWDVLLSGAYLDATVEDVPFRIGSPLPPQDRSPTYAPELQITALARYQWQALGGIMAIQGDAQYSDEFYYNLRNFDADKFDSYVIANARLSWIDPTEHWEVTLMARNFTDERAGNIGFDLATLCGCNELSFREPRWYGVSLRYNIF